MTSANTKIKKPTKRLAGPAPKNMAAMKQRYQAQAEVAKALAHWSRLMIIGALAEGDNNVGQLTELVGADASTVSRHLAVLKGAGIIEDRRSGNRVYYHLKTPCVTSFFDCAMEVIQTDLGSLKEVAR